MDGSAYQALPPKAVVKTGGTDATYGCNQVVRLDLQLPVGDPDLRRDDPTLVEPLSRGGDRPRRPLAAEVVRGHDDTQRRSRCSRRTIGHDDVVVAALQAAGQVDRRVEPDPATVPDAGVAAAKAVEDVPRRQVRRTAGRTTAARTATRPTFRATSPNAHITCLSTSLSATGVRRLATVVDQRWTRPRPWRVTRTSHIPAPTMKYHGESEEPPMAAVVRKAASSGNPATPASAR